MLERHFEVPFIAGLWRQPAPVEYPLPFAAGPPGATAGNDLVFRGLLLAEFAAPPLRDTFYRLHHLTGRHIADPMIGDGRRLLAAYRLGCDITGYDSQPLACWRLRQVIEPLPWLACQETVQRLLAQLQAQIGQLYRTRCPHCQYVAAQASRFFWSADSATLPLSFQLAAIEYHCPRCRQPVADKMPEPVCKAPDSADLECLAVAQTQLQQLTPRYLPTGAIAAGVEHGIFERWGLRDYRQLSNARQALALELAARFIGAQSDQRIRQALATGLVDWCCRRTVGPRWVETNPLTDWPALVDWHGGVPLSDDDRDPAAAGVTPGRVNLYCLDAAHSHLPAASLDAVLTTLPVDPTAGYGPLADYAYRWLRELLGTAHPLFSAPSLDTALVLSGAANQPAAGTDSPAIADQLSRLFQRMAIALKPGQPFIFTYRPCQPVAYYPLALALLDAGLTCSGCFPCPLATPGTDTVPIVGLFVCRTTGFTRRRWLVQSAEAIAALVQTDLALLQQAENTVTAEDRQGIASAHLTRLIVWHLRAIWDNRRPLAERLRAVAQAAEWLGGPAVLEQSRRESPPIPAQRVMDECSTYAVVEDLVAF